MTRSEAARLRAGARVLVGEGEWWEHGTVVHATPRGGVLVSMDRGGQGWHPYSRVHLPEG